MPGAAEHSQTLTRLPHPFWTLWNWSTIWTADEGHLGPQLRSSGTWRPHSLFSCFTGHRHRSQSSLSYLCGLAFPDLSLCRQLSQDSLGLQPSNSGTHNYTYLVLEKQQGPAAAPLLQGTSTPWGVWASRNPGMAAANSFNCLCINNTSRRKLGATFQDCLYTYSWTILPKRLSLCAWNSNSKL